MSAPDFNEIDQFLEHSGGGGGRSRYLKNWTKNGSVRIWLHTRQMPLAVWEHQFPTLVVFDDKDTGEQVTNFWSRSYVCWESEKFLKVQYQRDRDDGTLDVEPRKCSLCRLVDAIHMAVYEGKIDWTDPVFEFGGSTDGKSDQRLLAGGICGLCGSDRLTAEQIKELKDAGVRRDESWKENMHAKLRYVFTVVDNDEVGDGVQVAPQPLAVGQAVQKCIRDVRADVGEEEGNPTKFPYCIELVYDKPAPPAKKYSARRITRHKITPEIEALIKSPPPSLAFFRRPFNQASLRPYLEKHALIELPWDEIFRVPQLVADDDNDEDTSFPHGANANEQASAPAPAAQTNGFRRRTAAAPPPPQSSAKNVATIPCDNCGKPMPEDAEKCNACGQSYAFDDDDNDAKEPDPTPAPPPKKGTTTGASKIPFAKR